MNSIIKQTSNMAIVSLVSGILGWTLLPWIGSVVAVITGHMARAEIRRSPDTMEGDGLAIAGLVLGWTVLALSILTIIFIVVLILFFGGLAAIGLGSNG
jgi:hypothetical protein